MITLKQILDEVEKQRKKGKNPERLEISLNPYDFMTVTALLNCGKVEVEPKYHIHTFYGVLVPDWTVKESKIIVK